jgi:hypothetical protein
LKPTSALSRTTSISRPSSSDSLAGIDILWDVVP